MADKRQQRTRRRLRKAMVSLMHEQDFDDIRVIDLVERADIALPTFYRNYANKLGLLKDTITHLTEHFDSRRYAIHQPIDRLLDPDLQPHLLPILYFIEAERTFFKRLLEAPCTQLTFETTLKMMSETIQTTTPEWTQKEANLLAGCIIGNMYQWILLDLPYTIEEMARMIHWSSMYGVLLTREEHEDAREMIRSSIAQRAYDQSVSPDE